jgi:hypothetical protein
MIAVEVKGISYVENREMRVLAAFIDEYTTQKFFLSVTKRRNVCMDKLRFSLGENSSKIFGGDHRMRIRVLIWCEDGGRYWIRTSNSFLPFDTYSSYQYSNLKQGR